VCVCVVAARRGRGRERVCVVAPLSRCYSVAITLWYTLLWGGYGQKDRLNYRSHLQKSLVKETFFCKRDV